MSSSRINLGKASQEMYQGVAQLDNLVTEQLAQAGIKEGFAHLLRLRASQLNQCAYCVRLLCAFTWQRCRRERRESRPDQCAASMARDGILHGERACGFGAD